MPLDLSAYPGGELVAQGIADLEKGVLSESALVVLFAAAKLETLGIAILHPINEPLMPSHALYELLEERDLSTAYQRYNALMQLVVSFANAYRS